MKKWVSCLLVLAVLLTLCQGAALADSAAYAAGIYEGVSANGRNGEVAVEVTLSDTAIDQIVVTRHQETAGISDPAINAYPADIVKYQSLAVDTVTGCTISCNAVLEAVIDALTKAGADVEALKSVEVVPELSTETIELSAELVVIGGGGAGMSAAVTAADEGAHVILLEKMGALGGNTIISGGWLENMEIADEQKAKNNESYQKMIDKFFADGPQDEEEAAVWDELVAQYDAFKLKDVDYVFDSPLYLAVDYHRLEGQPVSTYLSYGEKAISFCEWMTDAMDCVWNDSNTGIVGYQWPRWNSTKGFTRGTGFFHYLTQYVEDKDLPVDIYLNTPATELITDENGRVTGVVAVAKTGETYRITAEKGVLLCTGGYAANGEMLVEYNTMWEGMTEDVHTDNAKGNTGDGIVMAQKLGAATDMMDNQMMFPLGDINTGEIGSPTSGPIYVNAEGYRFVDETADRFTICRGIFAQTGDMMYLVGDANNSGVTAGDELEEKIASGVIFRADTIEELAQQFGADPQALAETVAKHNESCKTLEDEFGRVIYSEEDLIVTPPFYASASAPTAHITIGGLVTGENDEVLREDGTPIEGLYAAGEVCCGSSGISSLAFGRHLALYLLGKA